MDDTKGVSSLFAKGKMSKSELRANVIPFMGFVCIFLLFSLTTQNRFLTLNNFEMLMTQVAIVMVAGVGASFVMAHGNLEFSIGGACAICAVAGYFASRISPWLALPAGILVGVLFGALTAYVHTRMNVPAFVVGMCIMIFGKGLVQTLSMTVTAMNAPASFSALNKAWFYALVVIVVFIAGYILMEYTKIGRFNKAIGSNANVAALSGVNVTKYKAIAFMISGFCIGICSFLTLIRSGAVSSTTGQSLETNVLISLVLGGMPLAGGTRVRMRSVLLGTASFYMLSNGLSIWGVNPDLVNIIKGAIFLLCVYFTYDRDSSTLVI